MGNFIDEVHLSFTHIADAYENEVDREAAHLHLIRSHCDGKAKSYGRYLRDKNPRPLILLLPSDRPSIPRRKKNAGR